MEGGMMPTEDATMPEMMNACDIPSEEELQGILEQLATGGLVMSLRGEEAFQLTDRGIRYVENMILKAEMGEATDETL